MPRAGRYRHRISILTVTHSQPSDGADSVRADGPAVVTNEPAWLDGASASNVERRVGAAVDGPVSHLVGLRYRPGVTTSHRVALGARRFDVVGVHVDERERELVLAVDERLE